MSAPRAVLVASNHGEIVGGGEISLLGLLEGLDRARWTPTVVVPAEGPVAARCRALGLPVSVIPWPTLRRPGLAAVRSVLALHRLARSTGARLLHANGSRVMAYAGLAGRRGGLPVIWHVRVADRDRFLDRLLAALARAIIVNSRVVARRFDWAPHKVRCIPNGVDLARVTPRPASPTLRASLGLPEGAPVVASVGRFVAFKGYSHLLEAARLVHQAAPAAHWLLVGDGELRGELESHCRRLGLESRVHFTGWREDVPDLLALCDVFVLPSLGEHFGRVLIEAMAMARVVVATDAGGVPEIVVHGETGLLVPPAQPKPLAGAVLGLLEHPARAARLGAAGRRRAEATFSLTRHVAAVEALYTELAGTDPNNPGK
jgi:glycosyltransferase involved in cell wall biosynthesis